MKKAIISALCSAFIIPGLGQILNQQLKKAIIMLGAVLVLFVLAIIKLYSLLGQVFKGSPNLTLHTLDTNALINSFLAQDLSTLYWIVTLSMLLWLYSIVDAFVYGLKQDRKVKEKS